VYVGLLSASVCFSSPSFRGSYFLVWVCYRIFFGHFLGVIVQLRSFGGGGLWVGEGMKVLWLDGGVCLIVHGVFRSRVEIFFCHLREIRELGLF